MRFTNKGLQGLKPKAGRLTLTEDGGLSIRVSPGGGKTFSCLVRVGSTVRRVTLGAYRDTATSQLGQATDRSAHGLKYLSLADARVKLALRYVNDSSRAAWPNWQMGSCVGSTHDISLILADSRPYLPADHALYRYRHRFWITILYII